VAREALDTGTHARRDLVQEIAAQPERQERPRGDGLRTHCSAVDHVEAPAHVEIDRRGIVTDHELASPIPYSAQNHW
jgi:hypothetical protein